MSYQSIPGWSSFLKAYDKMVALAKDGDVIVEAGVCFGRSLAYLGEKVIESKKQIRIIAVDTWPDNPGWGGPENRAFVEQCGGPFRAFLSCMTTHAPAVLERVDVWRMRTDEAFDALHINAIKPVGILIDADHDYDGCKADIEAALQLIRPGGLVAGDDYDPPTFPGVVRAVEECCPGYVFEGTTWYARGDL